MSKYYTGKRQRNVYSKEGEFKISRSKIELFMDCPRCFYLDLKKGIGRPPGFPFTLNSAVDTLLKQEFDVHRAKKQKHPLMKMYGVDAIPTAHKQLDDWRNNFVGVQAHHKPTNLLVFGAIDDLWINPKGEYIVVDYKATSVNEKITGLDKAWHISYKRQMEIYQWLLKQNGFKVSDTGYFVYCNGIKDKQAFDAKLEFEITVIPYTGDSGWIDNTLLDIKKCLNSDVIPQANPDCDYCLYRKETQKIENKI